MSGDKRTLRKALKAIIDNIDQSVTDIYDGIEADLAYIALAICDDKKLEEEMEKLKESRFRKSR